MIRYYCDKCKAELSGIDFRLTGISRSDAVSKLILKTHVGTEEYALCAKCRDEFIEWIRGNENE